MIKLVGGKWRNWSGGVKCRPRRVLAPSNEIELAAAIRISEGPIRAVGSGHSFTPIAASDGELLDLAAFAGLKNISFEFERATFFAATPLWAIGPALHPHGFALNNMGDIDRQTLAGAVATATHGTGSMLRCDSAYLSGFRLILADGSVLNCSAEDNVDIFQAGRVALGTLGVMTEITLSVRPHYRLTENDFLLPSDELFERLDELVADNRHFEFFWFAFSDTAVCKSLNETERPAPVPAGAETMRRRGACHGLEERVFAGLNEALPYLPFLARPVHGLFSRVMPRPARARWSHEVFPSARPVRFDEMEYALPSARGADCLRELVTEIRKKRLVTGFPLEFRTVAADDIPLSPFFERDSATIAVHQFHKVDPTALFAACEAIFRNHGGRPHWAKRHSRTRDDLATLYPGYERFCALRRSLDPRGKFLNPYLRALFE
ncbi:MAG: D-arabinono-1,4-lactone oxidase [Rhizomicrobium sp.]